MTLADCLRSIAERPDEDAGRLRLAELLEGGGAGARAEFIRAQCELAAADLPEKRRQLLRLRERALLDGHRQEWVRALGLPAEDVRFKRGLVAALRLARWEDGKALQEAYAPWLATVTELDLSGLGLGDGDLARFAESARFPALRKLMLNDNRITDAGAAALAKADGLPRLETVYLFGNSITGAGGALLTNSGRLRLKQLDVGRCAAGYCQSSGQTEMARRQFVREQLMPLAMKLFEAHPQLRSAMLCIAQYWADEADDAVHEVLIVSELPIPDLEHAQHGDYGDGDEGQPSPADANVPNTHLESKWSDGGSTVSLWEHGLRWDDNDAAIPVWAAFAPENGSQEYDRLAEVYAPAVLLFKHGGHEILPMQRPHLDGIRPEWQEGE